MLADLSVYILTKNSAKYLSQNLVLTCPIAQDICIVDSGSDDDTIAIASQFKCRIFYRRFDNFREQRTFAITKCKHKYVLSFDSDEIPTTELIDELAKLKESGFDKDAYTIQRNWFVLGQQVQVMYPVVCPDYPIRLFNKELVCYDERSTTVHETPHGFTSLGQLNAAINHFTFETKKILAQKLDFYTTIAAQDLIDRKKPVSHTKMLTSPIAALVKWYIIKGGYRDGWVGISLAKYVFDYTYLKYKKALKLRAIPLQ